MELVHPSGQIAGNEPFLFLRCKKFEQEFFDYLTKVEVLAFLLGWLSMTFVL